METFYDVVAGNQLVLVDFLTSSPPGVNLVK